MMLEHYKGHYLTRDEASGEYGVCKFGGYVPDVLTRSESGGFYFSPGPYLGVDGKSEPVYLSHYPDEALTAYVELGESGRVTRKPYQRATTADY